MTGAILSEASRCDTIAEMLIDIQNRRNDLPLHPAAATGQAITADLQQSRAILLGAVDFLKTVSAIYPPFYSPFQEFMKSVEADFAPPKRQS